MKAKMTNQLRTMVRDVARDIARDIVREEVRPYVRMNAVLRLDKDCPTGPGALSLIRQRINAEDNETTLDAVMKLAKSKELAEKISQGAQADREKLAEQLGLMEAERDALKTEVGIWKEQAGVMEDAWRKASSMRNLLEEEAAKGMLQQLELADAAIAYICKGRDGKKEEARLRTAVETARSNILKGPGWTCEKCGWVNLPVRTKCRECKAPPPSTDLCNDVKITIDPGEEPKRKPVKRRAP